MSIEISDHQLTYEEERGKPMPSLNHSYIEPRLAVQLVKHQEYSTFIELSLDLNGRLLTPDICIYPRRKIDFRHDIIRCTEPPLLVVEIISPMQASQTVMEKVDAYFQAGVKSCWVVFPPSRSVAIYTHDGGEKTYTEGTITDPATGVTADLDVVFS